MSDGNTFRGEISNECAKGTEPKCQDCRHGHSRPIRVTQPMRDYWLQRFSLDEIRELAAGLDA